MVIACYPWFLANSSWVHGGCADLKATAAAEAAVGAAELDNMNQATHAPGGSVTRLEKVTVAGAALEMQRNRAQAV